MLVQYNSKSIWSHDRSNSVGKHNIPIIEKILDCALRGRLFEYLNVWSSAASSMFAWHGPSDRLAALLRPIPLI